MTDIAKADDDAGVSLQITGFWRRLFAFFIDGFVLGVLGIGLGLILHDYFAGLGSWGRAIGFVIALAYFSVMNSRLCNGQTVGKRLMKIRVVGDDGKTLGIGKSTARSAVLSLPYFLNGAQFGSDILQSWFVVVLSVLVFGVGISILYLFVFNRRTRQSLHDLIVASYVTRVADGPVTLDVESIWRGHYATVAIIMSAALLAPIYMGRLASTEPFASLLPLQKALAGEPGIQYATVSAGTNWSITVGKGKQSQSNISARVSVSNRNTDFDSLANRLARIVLNSYPNAAERDLIAVSISYGYDIGIASASQTRNYVFSPTQWRRRFDLKSNVRLETDLQTRSQSSRAVTSQPWR